MGIWYNNRMKTEISTLLNQDSNVAFGYLFGSFATGGHDARSDVDVAVYVVDPSLDARMKLHHALQKALGRDIDLVVLNETRNIYLLEAILRDGIVLKDHPDREYFEVMKHHEVLDYKHFRKYIDAA